MRYKYLSDDELAVQINSYLGGDIQAGDRIIRQYDSLIKKSILNYFKRYDLHIGWSVEDVQQQVRLKILQSLKHFRHDRCPFPYWIIQHSLQSCGRFIRYSSSLKRHHKKQCDYEIEKAAHIPDNSVKQPDQIALENEFWNIIEERIRTLDTICQAVYEVAIEEREGVYGSKHPLLTNLGNHSIQLRLEKVRRAVRQVLESY